MINTFKTAIKHNAGRIAALAVALVAFATLLTGCIDDKELDYLYTVGIEDYSYTGSWQLGPMDYLSGLNVAERFTVTAGKESDADAQALSRFEAEMNKIDPAQMDASGACRADVYQPVIGAGTHGGSSAGKSKPFFFPCPGAERL